jgi:hypothetical protein
MVSADFTAANTISITYNEDVSCPAAADADFVYDSSTGTSGGTVTACADADTTTLTLTVTVTTLPTATASVIYTAPAAGNTITTSVLAGTAVVPYVYPQFPATQTLALTVPAAPVMDSASYVSGTELQVTYSEPVSCGATTDAAFAYFSAGTTSGGAITAGSCSTAGDVLTLHGAAFTAPVGTTGSIVYTAPASPTTANAVTAEFTSVYAATQTVTLTGTPAMVSAVVTATTITVTYGQPVSCPTTFNNDWTYYSATLPSDSVGGVVTGCTSSGDVLTLTATGGFNAPQGTAELLYTSPAGANPVNAVFATGTTVVAATQPLPGSDITA